MTFKEYRKSEKHSAADYLVRGLMRQGTIVALGGRPGSGKTAFAVALAQALDQGEPFLVREVKEAAVAYIAVEDEAITPTADQFLRKLIWLTQPLNKLHLPGRWSMAYHFHDSALFLQPLCG